MSSDAVEAAISFLVKLDPATQREVLERFDEVLQFDTSAMPSRLRKVAVHGKEGVDGRVGQRA